jgi:hypothetical protein
MSSATVGGSLSGMLSGIVQRNLRNLPRFLISNGLWIAALSALWLWLHTQRFLPAIGGLLVFLTAAYNNWIAKALYINIVHSVIIPMVRGRGDKEPLSERYARTQAAVMKAFGLLGKSAPQVFLLYMGIGLVISNVLTRNNKSDKYLICLMFAFAIFDALSRGARHPWIQLFQAGYKDATGQSPTLDLTYAAMGSFAVGLVLSFIPGLMSNNFWDYKGYILGAIVIGLSLAAGAVGQKAGGKNAGQPS